MKFPEGVKVFGDKSFRGACASELVEQVNFFQWLRFNHPELAALTIHPKNEGKRSWSQVTFERKAGGLNKGASDIIILTSPVFACELKRADHTKSAWKAGQVDFLKAVEKGGGFSCVALGSYGAIDALNYYLLSVRGRPCQELTKLF